MQLSNLKSHLLYICAAFFNYFKIGKTDAGVVLHKHFKITRF